MSDTIKIYPSSLRGTVQAPPSKSAAHRALICGALAKGESIVRPLTMSQDISATIQGMEEMGAEIKEFDGGVNITGILTPNSPAQLSCRESGSTLRFVLPIAAALGITAQFSGEGRLPERPIDILTDSLKEHGITFSSSRLPFTISGQLKGGVFTLPGNISSQFVSGLLFALPLLKEDSEIRLTTPLQSAGYVDMTLNELKKSGIQITVLENGYHIPGGQIYLPGEKMVETDYSNGAFWLCAGAINGAITIRGLDSNSIQGDKAVLKILQEMGAGVHLSGDMITAAASSLSGCVIDAGPIPDLIPILAVTAAFSHEETQIINAARLRIKESDRLFSTAELLRNLGGRVQEFPDRLVIYGQGGLTGGQVDGFNDHRIVMSAAVAAVSCKEPVIIHGYSAISKSYPDFFKQFKMLGGNFDVI
ncbi:3-phosphoshikimate 1-carboxyvinyltransferase [Youxingia wuxianensis]|uniref:3-phosphoshikimate 1-carboxyvinyltransferase n=1 Tax=Youxingia wuxianensis TaxID=2763678 RepID=A0A926ELC0_9FIRM|nr:3-phosphoshikimate 1-carboxyvinyltransferase [Youxingia wuxianensis]MBC8584711.1 3-phosphoshikimate 1-carboxyvinyltransferase [Youxingia wuxianensis]